MQRPGEQVVHQLDGDEIEHDRAQDLVDAEVALEGAGDRTPEAAAGRAGEDRQRDQDDGREAGQRERGRRREQRTHGDLALAADVEHVRPERDADPDADEQERDGLHRRRAQRVAVAEGAVEERAVAGDGVRAERSEHDGADEEGRERRRRQREPREPNVTPVEPWHRPPTGG